MILILCFNILGETSSISTIKVSSKIISSKARASMSGSTERLMMALGRLEKCTAMVSFFGTLVAITIKDSIKMI